jgi:hypothetical protein
MYGIRVENSCILYISTTAFPILKRRDKTPRTLRGKTLSIHSVELAVGESESIFRYYDCLHVKVREGKAGALNLHS